MSYIVIIIIARHAHEETGIKRETKNVCSWSMNISILSATVSSPSFFWTNISSVKKKLGNCH